MLEKPEVKGVIYDVIVKNLKSSGFYFFSGTPLVFSPNSLFFSLFTIESKKYIDTKQSKKRNNQNSKDKRQD